MPMTTSPATRPRRFHLIRNEDFTGVSGTGAVAEGIQFSDGVCAMHWIVPPAKSTALYDSVDELILIHGHDGRTEVSYLDE